MTGITRLYTDWHFLVGKSLPSVLTPGQSVELRDRLLVEYPKYTVPRLMYLRNVYKSCGEYTAPSHGTMTNFCWQFGALWRYSLPHAEWASLRKWPITAEVLFFIIKTYNIHHVESNSHLKRIFKNVTCCVNYDSKIWISIVDCTCFEGNETQCNKIIMLNFI